MVVSAACMYWAALGSFHLLRKHPGDCLDSQGVGGLYNRIFTSQYFLLFAEYQDRGLSVMTYLAKDPILIITSLFLNILLIITIIAGVIYLR